MTAVAEHMSPISRLVSGRVEAEVPLSALTSFRIGGPADVVVQPATGEELAAVLQYVREHGVRHILLGAGTNVLCADVGFRGVVIRTTALQTVEVVHNGRDSSKIVVDAGVPLQFVIYQAVKQGLTGIEALWGIPGSFGGGVVTNAGAGSVWIGDLLESVRIVDVNGREREISGNELASVYRGTNLPEGSVVVGGRLRLKRGDPGSIEAALEQAKTKRRTSQPMGARSAGCVFKNPSPDKPAGLLLDRLGLKGTRSGDAEVSTVHANFIVNTGKARATDVKALIEIMRSRVLEEHGIDLELEIGIIEP